MLIFADANLTLFAMPKTGSTAYHMALKSRADIVLARRAGLKHIPVRRYEKFVLPMLERGFGMVPERAAVMRDPLDYMRSWYRYRQRPERAGSQRSAEGVDFDGFIRASMQEKPPAWIPPGNQLSFLVSGDGGIHVEHLFAYERIEVFHAFLEERLGQKINAKPRNVSPPAQTGITPQTEALFRAARAEEYALHARILAAGGHLRPEAA